MCGGVCVGDRIRERGVKEQKIKIKIIEREKTKHRVVKEWKVRDREKKFE